MKTYRPTPARLAALGFTHQPAPLAPDAVQSYFDAAAPAAQTIELRCWPGRGMYCFVLWHNQAPQLYAYAEWSTQRSFLSNLHRTLAPLIN